jgi:hypothetical protein
VRNPGGATRLEHRAADGHDDHAAIGIGEADGTEATVVEAAGLTRHQHEGEHGDEGDSQAALHQLECRRLLGTQHAGLAEHALDGPRIRRSRGHGPPALGEPEKGEYGHEEHGSEEERGGARVPGAEAQPEVQTDAAVQPGDDEHERLTQACAGVERPHAEEQTRIGVDAPEPLEGQARSHDVSDEPQGNGQTQRELQCFPRWHAQRPPAVERTEGERHVHDERCVQHERGERVTPHREEDAAARFHRLDRDEAEGVVGEVGREIGEQH